MLNIVLTQFQYELLVDTLATYSDDVDEYIEKEMNSLAKKQVPMSEYIFHLKKLKVDLEELRQTLEGQCAPALKKKAK